MRLIDADKLIDSLRASLNHGCETFPVDLIVEAIENQLIEENICCSKEIHAYQNEDGTYRVRIITTYPDKEKYIGKEKFVEMSESESEIERAAIHITAYACKDNNKLCSFTIKQ